MLDCRGAGESGASWNTPATSVFAAGGTVYGGSLVVHAGLRLFFLTGFFKPKREVR